ncbi:hypothetical protein HUT18_07500 [Streptomyces sp. NA04227]|uniref:hypothetical protein n=1 Tax=Streptomyces sp. NA04227 TaxID=2742136 RepID=UPI001592A9C5|nr:hypothetical protein [Streptomyces sp. NA04227]QKW06269.1 hypothetical protein HUT18_07500 [Streptomyces sp. NA04227]
MAATYDFPSDLLAGQEELHRVRAELLSLLKRLPWSVEPLDGFSETQGWRKVERPASPGWSPDEQAQVELLRKRERELAVFVTCHHYWTDVQGPDAVDARSALKHAPAAPVPLREGATRGD